MFLIWTLYNMYVQFCFGNQLRLIFVEINITAKLTKLTFLLRFFLYKLTELESFQLFTNLFIIITLLAMFLVPTRSRDYFFKDPWFQHNWINYEQVRQCLSRAGSATWNHLNKFSHGRLQKLVTLVPLGYTDILKEEAGVGPFPQRWMVHSMADLDKERTDLGIFRDSADMDLIRLHEDEQGNMEISLDTHLYTPEEIKVYIKDDQLVVCGRQESWSGDGRQMVIHSFKRSYKLPGGVEKKNVKTDLSKDGVLVINVKVTEPEKEQEMSEKIEGEAEKIEKKMDPFMDGWIVHPVPDKSCMLENVVY